MNHPVDVGSHRPFSLPQVACFHYGAIDAEHLQLIEVLNDAIMNFGLDDKMGGAQFSGHIERLLNHLATHFQNEEQAMASVGYDGLAIHHAHHVAITATLEHMRDDALSRSVIDKELVFDAFDQVLKDLLRDDLPFKDFLSARNLIK